MNNISFSSNNVNNKINNISSKKDKTKDYYLLNKFQCNMANNKIDMERRTVVLGERVNLWK